MAELFGFTIKRSGDDKAKSFVAPAPDDGSLDIGAAAGFFGQYYGAEAVPKNDFDLVKKYRMTAEHPEADQAIEDIVNEAILASVDEPSVSLVLNFTNYSTSIKKKIRDEFSHCLKLLHWNQKGHEFFKRWYVDGRIYFHKMVDTENPKKGVQEVRYIDPRNIKKVREIQKEKNKQGVDIVKNVKEFFLYNEEGIYPAFHGQGGAGTGAKISKDAVVYVTSGYFEPTSNQVYSYLHKAIKPVNQLRMIEDAIVIYRISRAPERRIFYIDVGNLPKQKAEQYLKDIMNRYRNKLVYDASSGEVRDDRQKMSMLEDFWLPRREGGRGTEITTLPGGQNLGELEDVKYFQNKLYRALNVPISRMESDSGFNLGRSTEITRDEVKFTKFVDKLRRKFTDIFHDLLRTQLILKGIITPDDWEILKEQITYDFLQDNHFSELKDAEILGERIDILDRLTDYIGTYYSHEWVRKNVLRQSDREIEVMDAEIEAEKKKMGDDEGGTDAFL
tara:strand:+ start:219 stop:1724 length:1506 start_codon:yes stop_codon:yes gene_type:complete